MSTQNSSGSHYENHQRITELQDNAAHAHRTAAAAQQKQDHETGPEQSRKALEHSQHAELSQNAGTVHGIPVFGHADIAALAYQLWEDRGCPYGSPEEDWHHAVRELRSRRTS